MGAIKIFLCIFVGHLMTGRSAARQQDAIFPQVFPGFLENHMAFPLEANFDFTPYDTIFSSWQTRTPDFHTLAESPPIMTVPRVQVFCDESKLTLLVDKRFNGIVLSAEEIQLGNGCYSNRELSNHFIFIYSPDQCGTTHVMQNGLKMFTNSLHFNLKKPLPTWWQTSSTVHVSCTPKRLYNNPNYFASPALPENDKSFNMKVMNPYWSSSSESDVYKRGQVINLQVSTTPRPGQQLFIQSCFLSTSPDPQTRPKHSVIMNKGCTASHSSPAVVQFVASNRADAVNFVLNTSYLVSELYIHCSVLTSDHGVTFGSKSCNYNVIHSRWEELNGDVDVCECCRSKCKGLSVKHLSEGTKAVVSTGPLVFEDKDVETSLEFSDPGETMSIPVTDSMQPDFSSETETAIVSGASIARNHFSSPPHGVVVVSQDPVARLTLWLPGQIQDTEHSHNIASQSEDNLIHRLNADYLPEPSTADQESLYPPSNKINSQSLNELKSDPSMWDLTSVDGWPLPPQLDSAVIVEEFQRKTKCGASGKFGTEAQQKRNVPTSDEMNVKDLKNDFNQMNEELAQMQSDAPVVDPEGTSDVQPIIRSKIQFSKGVDGSQTLSYEEERKERDRKEVIRRCGMHCIKQESAQKELYSTFLNLLRRMDKAE